MYLVFFFQVERFKSHYFTFPLYFIQHFFVCALDFCIVLYVIVDYEYLFIFYTFVSLHQQIDEEVAKLLELKARLGGDDGKQVFVLKTAKV